MATKRRGALASLALGLFLAVGTAGCAVSAAGHPVSGSTGGSGAGTQVQQGSGSGTQVPGHGSAGDAGGPCAAERTGPNRPDPGATPLVLVSGTSPWSPPWTSRASLALYPDGTGALIAHPGDANDDSDDDGKASISVGGSAASEADGASDTAATPSLRPVVGGWIDACAFDDLTAQLDELTGADYGMPQVFDAGATVLTVTRGAGQDPTVVSVYALSVAGADDGLTAAQSRARHQLRDWLERARHAITGTGPLADRIRISSTGSQPWSGAIAALAMPEQRPVPWEGPAVPADCRVVTGAEAATAMASMRDALRARTSSTDAALPAWGAFTVPGQDAPTYLGMQQVLPGDGCR